MSVSIRELCDVKKCAKRLDNSEKQRGNIEDNLHRILKATNGYWIRYRYIYGWMDIDGYRYLTSLPYALNCQIVQHLDFENDECNLSNLLIDGVHLSGKGVQMYTQNIKKSINLNKI